jgi:hypothetical protein
MKNKNTFKPLDINSFMYGWSAAATGFVLGMLTLALIKIFFL